MHDDTKRRFRSDYSRGTRGKSICVVRPGVIVFKFDLGLIKGTWME